VSFEPLTYCQSMWTFIETCSLFKFSRNRYVAFGHTTGKGLTLLKSMGVLRHLPSKEPNFYFISTISNTAFSLDSREGFDTIPAVFDADVVNEYLDGTGQLRGHSLQHQMLPTDWIIAFTSPTAMPLCKLYPRRQPSSLHAMHSSNG
jgi:hypothetical protein